jgi:hypothetical protein
LTYPFILSWSCACEYALGVARSNMKSDRASGVQVLERARRAAERKRVERSELCFNAVASGDKTEGMDNWEASCTW